MAYHAVKLQFFSASTKHPFSYNTFFFETSTRRRKLAVIFLCAASWLKIGFVFFISSSQKKKELGIVEWSGKFLK